MDSKKAVQNYIFAERAKVNMIAASQMTAVLSDFKGAEKTGAKKMIDILLNIFQSDLELGFKTTGSKEFSEAVSIIDEVKKMIENEDFSDASNQIGIAITKVTTPAQEAWQKLSENELV
ncbi:hypothetical protein F1737_02480 [Methanoplanus sp. FWC-SCC4]|uniref:Uncharacterized protein n=1 Tax=Methanochimaera problematica TaxID=2609417 RepID=A0AA97I3V0_9EURY|nr:hypothetical protein [Methanoplanus sp. FWC-SCC4]WOF15631.1 hypothetical protein F1737_02480 [Methanoplanus sp. FWC-SCC4]